MTSKRETIKRLLIYLVLAFGISCLPELIFIWTGGDLNSPTYEMIAIFTMFGPAVANLLTRLITKEGFQNMYLRVNLKGNIRYYLLAIGIPFFYSILSGIILSLIYGGFLQAEAFKEMPVGTFLLFICFLVGVSVAVFFYTMGEELGWRGYMTPKLEELMGTPAALVTGGIIWGLWHLPGLMTGRNGSLWVSLLLQCVICFSMGAILTWLTKKTKSLYPAAICHAIHNNAVMGLLLLFVTEKTVAEHRISMQIWSAATTFLFGIVAFILLIRDAKKANTNAVKGQEETQV